MRLSALLVSIAGLLGTAVCAAPAAPPANPAVPVLGAREQPAPEAAHTVIRAPRSDLAAPACAPLHKREDSPELKELVADIEFEGGRKHSQADFVTALVQRVSLIFPQHNTFVFLRHEGRFGWGVVGEALDTTVAYQNLHFLVVLFRGAGVLTKKSGDGGWANWGWAGRATRNGDEVTFQSWV